MRYNQIPKIHNKVKLYCDYDEFDMELISLGTLEHDYGCNYNLVMPTNNIIVELKTDNLEYHNILTKIMYNYSNTYMGTYPALQFSLETDSDIFEEGYISGINEDINSETLSTFITLEFNHRVIKVIDNCEPCSA